MEFLETHTSKDAKAVWKNDIDVPVKEEAIEKTGDESDEDEEESKENKGKKNKDIVSLSFLLFLDYILNQVICFIFYILLSNLILCSNTVFYNKIIFFY